MVVEDLTFDGVEIQRTGGRPGLSTYEPDVVVVNAGAARFTGGDQITTTAEDVSEVLRQAPDPTIIAVHMEAINHCLLTRNELRNHLSNEDLLERYAPASLSSSRRA